MAREQGGLTHVEVYSDGTCFYVGKVQGASGAERMGIIEAKNLARTTDDAKDEAKMDTLAEVTFAHGVSHGYWVLEDLAKWEDSTFANYEGGRLTRVYRWTGTAKKTG